MNGTPLSFGRVGEIDSLEALSSGDSFVHRLHPAAKIAATLVLLVAVLSFNRYEIAALTPYLFYPFVLAALAGVPHPLLLRRFAPALPFCLLAGLGNVLFDRETALRLGGVAVSHGTLSLFAIILRAYLCVTSVLLLIAATPFVQLADQLRRMRIPGVLVTLFEVTYRYIGTLAGEAATMRTAYALRNPVGRGLKMRHMGSFAGQFLIRSLDRAERVGAAMACRGYGSEDAGREPRPLAPSDWAYLVLVCGASLALRMTDIPAFIGRLAATVTLP